MKKNLFFTIFIALLSMACSNEPKERPGLKTGKQSVITLTVYDAMVGTRAAGAVTETYSTGLLWLST